MRCLFLVTTALVLVGWVAVPAAADAPLNSHQHDVNGEFLCNYGFSITRFNFFSSGASSSSWTHVAVPIIGTGKTVRKILVKESKGLQIGSSQFTVGIYSNTASGVPGTLIAKGTQRAPDKCSWIGVSIAPTMLNQGTKYWVEETIKNFWQYSNAVLWATDPNAKESAYKQHHHFVSNFERHSSSTTGWESLSAGAYLRLK
jgi:hypothetical protein